MSWENTDQPEPSSIYIEWPTSLCRGVSALNPIDRVDFLSMNERASCHKSNLDVPLSEEFILRPWRLSSLHRLPRLII